MCGRYRLSRLDLLSLGLRHDDEQYAFEEFTEKPMFSPRFNVAPGQAAAVIRLDASGRPALSLVQWGLIPSWVVGKPKMQPINARAETLASSGMFRQAFERRRCLVLADGFYEPRGPKPRRGEPPRKQYFCRFLDDRLFALAGLWERWKPSADADSIDTFTIITTEPNAVTQSIEHDRSPVIVRREDYARWLDRNVPGKDVSDVLRPWEETPGDEMEAWRVGLWINSPKNDGPECVERVPDL